MTNVEFLLIKDVSFSYENKEPILKKISLSVFKKQIITIVGRSGSGKTTLLNLISNLLIPTQGQIKLNFHRSEISYLMQSLVLLPYRTALENAMLSLELRNHLNTHSMSRIEKMFKDFGIESAKSKYPDELSGGMKQRVALIQTLSINSDLYLLDEPFTAVDRRTSSVIEDFIWELFRENKSSAIIITHDLEQALSISDRVIILSDNGMLYNEINFDSDFVDCLPSNRKNSAKFEHYLFDIIKHISES